MLNIQESFFLGPIGLKMMQVYQEHDAIINFIICVYGIFLIASHFNYKRMMGLILRSLHEEEGGKTHRKKLQVNWEDLVNVSFFPFIAGPLNLIPARVSQESFLKIMDKDKNWQRKANGAQVTIKKSSA